MRLSEAIADAEKIVSKIDEMLPIAYESDRKEELGRLVLEIKGLALQVKAKLKNANGSRSSLPINQHRG